MKLNATSEMMPITWPEFANIHPFAPAEQTTGYLEMNATLNADLADITGFAAMSSQPNSGAQGEYAGLMCIKGYHASRGDEHRDICLIPVSAHGTNPASAVMAGMKVLTVQTDAEGNIDIEDLRTKATKHADKLAALMVTYPSTYVARVWTGACDECDRGCGCGCPHVVCPLRGDRRSAPPARSSVRTVSLTRPAHHASRIHASHCTD